MGLQLVVIASACPASVGLFLLADPLTELLFRHGAFDARDALQTSQMIRWYGIGVWAYSALLIVHRGFYAVGDRATPLRVGVLAMICNVVLSFSFIWAFGGWGLALSTAISAMLQVTLVTWAFQGQVGRLEWPKLIRTTLRAGLASLLMAVSCWGTLTLLDAAAISSRTLNVAAPVAVSILTYFAAAKMLNMQELAVLLPRGKR